MENAQQLANRLRELLLNGKLVAFTNYKDQLSDLTLKQATQKLGSLNTIALLTYHINYYLAGVINVFEGGKLEIRDKYSFDLPPLKSDGDWKKLRNDILNNAEKFANLVENMSDEKLNSDFAEQKYGTYRRNIEVTIEHGYYHLGQMVLIKKMILEGVKI